MKDLFQRTFLPRQANVIFLVIFRVLYSIVGLAYAIGSLNTISLRWYLLPDWIHFATALHYLWICLLILQFIGVGGRFRSLVHFLTVSCLLDQRLGTSYGFSVQESVYLIPAFWAVFIELDHKIYVERTNSSWAIRVQRNERSVGRSDIPVFLFGLNFGLILFSAGLHKFFDPLWRDGVGFYATLSLPWVRQVDVCEFADCSLSMTILNHGSILLECGFLFLILFAATRFLGVLLLLPFFGGLIFPMRLDFIGQIGLCYVPLLLSITPMPKIFYGKIGALTSSQNLRERGKLLKPYLMTYGVLVTIMSYMFLYFLVAALDFRRVDYLKRYERPENFDVSDEILESEVSYRETKLYSFIRDLLGPNRLAHAIYAINEFTVRQKFWHLFTRHHTIGIYAFRIVFTLNDGATLEPFKIFEEDLRGGKDTVGFVPRHAQAFMYAISNTANSLSMVEGFEPSKRYEGMFKAIIEFAKKQLPPGSKDKLVSSTVWVRPMNRDVLNSRGTVELPSEWKKCFELNEQRNSTDWFIPDRHQIQCRRPGLPNYWLTRFPKF